MDFDIWHNYTRAVDQGLISPLECPDDGWELKVQSDEYDNPILHCYMCGTSFIPGLNLLTKVKFELESIPT